MRQKLHISSRMFLKDPYVVRVTHPESPNESDMNLGEFRKMLRTAKLTIADTWGYSNPAFEVTKSDTQQMLVNGNTRVWHMPVTFECHSYWVFTNELDALHFRLSVGENALQMHMWPTKIKYTITEYYNDENTSS